MEKKVSFNELIKGNRPVLVDFTAEWCGPCRAMKPILKQVAVAVKGKASIIKIDIDRNRELARKLGIQGVPTFILFQGGEAKWRESGMRSAHALQQVIEKAINNDL